MLFVALMTATFTTSCSDDDENGGGETVVKEDQKSKFEAAAREFMGHIDANDFQNIADLAKWLDDNSHNDNAIEDWADAAMDACEISGYRTADIKRLFVASNFYGQFELQNGTWVKTGTGNNLQFTFKGNCVLTVECSGPDHKVHHDSFDTEDWDWNMMYGYYDITRYENTFAVPENIRVTLKQGGTTLAQANVKSSFTISDSNGEVNLKHDLANVTATVDVNQYRIVVDKAQYTGGSVATAKVASVTLSKGGKTLVTMSADGNGTPSNDDITPGQINISTDVLGLVQVRGSITDCNQMDYWTEEAYDNDDDETAFKHAINEANKYINLNIYFDGSNSSSSYIKLYPYKEDYYYDPYNNHRYEYWDYEAAIMFDDGTGYSFSDYFDDPVFNSVCDIFENLVEDFEDLVEEDLETPVEPTE